MSLDSIEKLQSTVHSLSSFKAFQLNGSFPSKVQFFFLTVCFGLCVCVFLMSFGMYSEEKDIYIYPETHLKPELL